VTGYLAAFQRIGQGNILLDKKRFSSAKGVSAFLRPARGIRAKNAISGKTPAGSKEFPLTHEK
jgi:hypothetical protein